MLAGPVVWVVYMEASYMLAPLACQTGSTVALHGMSAVSLMIIAVAGLFSWASWKKLSRGGTGRGQRMSRRSFMAAGGVALSCMFILVIIAQEIPRIMISPCLRE